MAQGQKNMYLVRIKFPNNDLLTITARKALEIFTTSTRSGWNNIMRSCR